MNNSDDRGLLRLLYAISLLVAIIVGCIAIYQFLTSKTEPSNQGATSISDQSSSNSGNGAQSGGGNSGSSSNQQLCPSYSREDLGLWNYNGNSPSYPSAPGDCKVIVAHGDINDSGTCHIKVFHTGEPVGNLGSGTFRLVRLTGSSDRIQQEINHIQQELNCPPL